MTILKRRLAEKDVALDSSRSKIAKQEQMLRKQLHLMNQIKDKLECPVCLDVPRKGPVPICPNGHFVCSNCKRVNCPTCRTAMGTGKSLLAATILENIEHKCMYNDCDMNLAVEALEKHEKVCPHRFVLCPHPFCILNIPLVKLVEHLKSSPTCCKESTDPLETKGDWIRNNYVIRVPADVPVVISVDWALAMSVFRYAGEVFAVFPMKTKGTFYFVLVMFAGEAVCSKYRVELIVHESESSSAFDADMTLKFQGSPISIDAKDEELKLFGASEVFMTKLLNRSVNKSVFSLSVRIFKKN